MKLEDVIKRLEKECLSKRVKSGFGRGDSYRGYYDQLAFEPRSDVDVHYMLLQAKMALGTTYNGYKGGRYKMYGDTNVNIAHYGACSMEGDELTSERLDEMLATKATGAE